MKTENFKKTMFGAMLVGALALPLATANAEGTKVEKNAATTGSSELNSQTFKALDADKSGSLTEEKYNEMPNASVSFNEADANADGKLTLSELRSIPQGSAPHSKLAVD
ncbi:MAG: hypothetical protein DI626_07865 [Micavibrio aeruginosavorus]|uniref:EF-hand domain-containing protein n=1 Tax=Micavibrio aeruginosavorus TaxID=349221 RepID=A0A2W4ZW09_9BACT|nr:MAG: hypothetical protein DI626_07865 [Micavibrio aeruginosavorus]